jgi:hypothetical protein
LIKLQQDLDMLGKEEFLWSPRYGLIGRLDSSIRVVQDGLSYIVPLNIKFSRFSKGSEYSFAGASIDARAHIMLLGLLVSERYDMPVGKGFLYFLDGRNILETVEWRQREIRDIFVMRNLLAFYARKKTFNNIDIEDVASRLPPVSWDEDKREKCFREKICLLYETVSFIQVWISSWIL